MNLFLRIDLNIMSVILLVITIVIANKKLDKSDKLNQFFILAASIIAFQTSLETITCIINGKNGVFVRQLSYIIHFLLFSIGPVLTYIWFNFVKFWIVPEKKFLTKKEIIYIIPILVNFIFTFQSFYKKTIFYLDSNNIYHRGDFSIYSSAIVYFYILYTFFYIIHHRKKIPSQEYVPLLFFGILPLIGGIIQSLFYGTLLMWSSCGFSLVIVYTFLQNRMVTIDFLTGAWSRESFFDYFYQKIHHFKKDVMLVFIDMDNLKTINDRFGHIEGDFAIETCCQLLKSAIKKTDIISRYGGDEFILLINNSDYESIQILLREINNKFELFNLSSEKDYKIEITYGFGIYDKSHNSLEDFIHKIDKSMYRNKMLKKQSYEFF